MESRRPANESKSKRNVRIADSQMETSNNVRKSDKKEKSRTDSQIETISGEPKSNNQVKSIRERIFGSSSNQKESITSSDWRKSEEEGKSRADSEIETSNNVRKSDRKEKSRTDSQRETISGEPKSNNQVKSIRESIFGSSSNKKESITSSTVHKSEKEGKSRADSEIETSSTVRKSDKKAKSIAEHRRTTETESIMRSSSVEFTFSSLRYTIHSEFAPKTDYGLTKRKKLPRFELFKLLVAFWIFGLCNNVGYIVMLSAAQDILSEITNTTSTHDEENGFDHDHKHMHVIRQCNPIGTGIIVVANIAPSIIVKFIAPFLPLMVHVRLIIVVIMTAFGFLSAAMGYGSAQGHWLAIFGVIVISFSSGLGESTLLAYTVFFSTKDVLSTWSSGTGAAGIVGAFLYSLLREAHVDVKNTLLIMLVWPMLMATTFWRLAKHPYIKKSKIHFSTLEEATEEQIRHEIPTVEDVHTTAGKFKILKRILFVYIAPYGLAFFFEYLINQSMYETLHFPDNKYFTDDNHYRWFLSTYLVGVFIARSSMNYVEVNNLWLLTILQIINALVILCEVLYGFLYFVLVCLACLFWEGLVGGISYVNTYRRISSELPPLQREFSMSMNTISDAIMITLAGSMAIPLHTFLCHRENPYEQRIRLRIERNLPTYDS